MPFRDRPNKLRWEMLLWIIAACSGLLCAGARADVIETTDGRRIEGIARFAEGGLVVTTGEETIRLKLGDIASLRRDAHSQGPQHVADTSGVIPSAGLFAEYFTDMEMTDLRSVGFKRALTSYGFNWFRLPPDKYNEPTFAARLTGWITIPRTGTYRFVGKGTSRLQIDGKAVADDEGNPLPFDFQAGQRVAVLIEKQHTQAGAHAYALLRWTIDGGALQVVPPACFSPAEEVAERMVAFHRQRLGGITFGGLKGEYFSDIEMTDLKLTRLDNTISQSWSRPTHVHPEFTEGFTARWTGKLKALKSATTNFQVTDRTRLWIDGQKIADDWPTTKGKTHKGKMDLEAGRLYDIRVEYTTRSKLGDRVAVWWDQEKAPRSDISTDCLYPPDDVPGIAIVLPMPGAWIDATDGATIMVAAQPGKGQIAKVELLDRSLNHVYGESTEPPFHVQLWPQQAGAMTIRARVTDTAGQTAVSEPVRILITSARAEGVPSPWSVGRVGPAAAPTARFSDNRVELTGMRGIFGDRGELPFLSRPLGVDEQLTARLVSLSYEDPQTPAMAGVVLRTGFDIGDAHVMLLASESGGWFLSRSSGKGEEAYVNKPLSLPVWLRVAREGPVATAYWSEDGEDWQFAGSVPMGESDELLAGLTAMAQNQRESVTAVFEDVSVRSAPAAFTARQPGIQLVNGSILYGEVKIEPDSIIVHTPGDEQFTFDRTQVARIIYSPILTRLLDDLPAGWRGAIVDGDLLEGEVLKVADDRVTVSSLIFGVREVQVRHGLAVAVLDDVRQDAQAMVVHHYGGCAVATDVRIDADRLVLDDPASGRLKLPIDEVLAISR